MHLELCLQDLYYLYFLRRSINFHPNNVELFVYIIIIIITCLLYNKLKIPNERNNNIEYNVD